LGHSSAKRVIRNRNPISYDIYSSIWSSIKSEFDNVYDQVGWLIGNGENMSFWNDDLCGVPLS